MPAAKKSKTPKQVSLTGTESPQIPELDKAARAYALARDERMELTATEKNLKATVRGLMKTHNLSEYFRRDDSIYVVLTADVKVRVK